MNAPVAIIVKRRFSAPPELVFDAWLDPAQASKWLFATANGVMIRAEADARVGGTFVFTDRRPDMGDVEHTGTYLQIERPHLLVFTFGVPTFSPDVDLVSVSIRPVEGGGCELTLRHEMKPQHHEYRDGSEKGWTKMLGTLAQVLETGN